MKRFSMERQLVNENGVMRPAPIALKVTMKANSLEEAKEIRQRFLESLYGELYEEK